jgi:tRNA-intron endonuclease
MTEKATDNSEKTQFEGNIEKDKVILIDKKAIDEFYYNSYIGTLEESSENEIKLILDPIEVLLLSERNRILLRKDNDQKNQLYDFESLLTYFTKFDQRLWQKYIIYMDLRKRGYIVRPGYGEGIDFLVYKRGSNFENDSAKYLIYPVFEGDPVELKELDRMSRVALSSRKDLIVATVDRLSKPIYYSVNKFEIINKINLDEKEYGR